MTFEEAHSSRSSGRLIRVAALITSSMLLLLVFELSIRSFAAVGLLSFPGPPAGVAPVWDSDHPIFGVWHSPQSTHFVQTRDFAVTYRINSAGARDIERPRDGPTSRVIMIGDSIVEGWGVEAEQRFSNILESSTGKPHLNFGMAHFGPYQSYLAYRYLAKNFSHDTVLLGVFPYNDFLDLDFQSAAHALGYEYRFRPYLVGEHPDYRHVDHREVTWRKFLRRRLYAYSAIDFILNRLSGHRLDEYRSRPFNEQGLPHSYYYDYSDEQLRLLNYSLALLEEESGERDLVVVLFPAGPDFARFAQSGPSPLAEELGRSGRNGALRVVDLLSAMAERGINNNRFKSFYVAPEHNDFHLSPRGNRVAARILERELADLYD